MGIRNSFKGLLHACSEEHFEARPFSMARYPGVAEPCEVSDSSRFERIPASFPLFSERPVCNILVPPREVCLQEHTRTYSASGVKNRQ